MQPRQNHQGRFSGFKPEKGAGNGHQAAEWRWGPLRGCGKEMLW